MRMKRSANIDKISNVLNGFLRYRRNAAHRGRLKGLYVGDWGNFFNSAVEMSDDIAELAKLYESVKSVIEKLPDEEIRSIMKMKYIDGKPVFKISGELSMSERTLYYTQKRALEYLAEHVGADALGAAG